MPINHDYLKLHFYGHVMYIHKDTITNSLINSIYGNSDDLTLVLALFMMMSMMLMMNKYIKIIYFSHMDLSGHQSWWVHNIGSRAKFGHEQWGVCVLETSAYSTVYGLWTMGWTTQPQDHVQICATSMRTYVIVQNTITVYILLLIFVIMLSSSWVRKAWTLWTRLRQGFSDYWT